MIAAKPHWASGPEWYTVCKPLPADIREFCVLHAVYPVEQIIDGVTWWRVVWKGSESNAIERAEEAGFDEPFTEICGAVLLFLREK